MVCVCSCSRRLCNMESERLSRSPTLARALFPADCTVVRCSSSRREERESDVRHCIPSTRLNIPRCDALLSHVTPLTYPLNRHIHRCRLQPCPVWANRRNAPNAPTHPVLAGVSRRRGGATAASKHVRRRTSLLTDDASCSPEPTHLLPSSPWGRMAPCGAEMPARPESCHCFLRSPGRL